MIHLIFSCLWPLGACRQILALFLTFSWLKKDVWFKIVFLILLHNEDYYYFFVFWYFAPHLRMTQRKQAAGFGHVWRALDYNKSSEMLISQLSLGQMKAVELPLKCLQLRQPKIKRTKCNVGWFWSSLDQF